jgi:hypothetical protein
MKAFNILYSQFQSGKPKKDQPAVRSNLMKLTIIEAFNRGEPGLLCTFLEATKND